ncbi:MAG TPA: hypothetical protein VH012_02905 [Acidimicrobiales bacterium]|jgi:hypothetical protein|nr:hypothetical protein [Acidimicrobiales bacterium]
MATRLGLIAGAAGSSTVAFSGLASAAPPPVPTFFWTVDPPTLGQTHSPDPVVGTTGVPTSIMLQLATNNGFNAPTGTVDFTDSLGLFNGSCTGVPVQEFNLALSTSTCTFTFPAATASDDVITASYSGDSENGATSGTQTISFGPGVGTPEVPFALVLPLSAGALLGGAYLFHRRLGGSLFH